MHPKVVLFLYSLSFWVTKNLHLCHIISTQSRMKKNDHLNIELMVVLLLITLKDSLFDALAVIFCVILLHHRIQLARVIFGEKPF
jgi:hypothetical protein